MVLSKKLKKRIKRTALGSVFFVAGMVIILAGIPIDHNIELIIFLAAYLIAGGDVIRSAVNNIGQGQLFDETFLMSVASIGAFFVGSYPEAAAVMIFYQVGECFQAYAVNYSRKSISQLMDIRPDFANVLRNGMERIIDPNEVMIGETILIRPGEKIPLDAVITKGSSSINTMALTGESMPSDVTMGDFIVSGCVNISGVLEANVIKTFGESTVSKILDLVENSSTKKASAENFITKFARYYTPFVVFAALMLAIVPSVITRQPNIWIYRALSFLVISCPCAFVVSVPLTFFGGLGAASKAGILIKGANYLETLSKAEIVVVDKTGTMTQGIFSIQDIKISEEAKGRGITGEKILEWAATLEKYSNHPISKAVVDAYDKKIMQQDAVEIQEIAGYGVQGIVEGHRILVGNDRFMIQNQIVGFSNMQQQSTGEIGTIIHVAADGIEQGYLVIADTIREEAPQAIAALYQKSSIKKIVMLTGDRQKAAQHTAEYLGIKNYEAELMPEDKVQKVEALLLEKTEKGKLLFVGDGINDAPVLARADVGIAMGGIGSDAAIEAADVVIMDDQPYKIVTAIAIAKRTVQIAMENSIFAIAVKGIILLLATVGYATMWSAIFADVGVTLLAILNAMRALQVTMKK